MIDGTDICALHDEALAQWAQGAPGSAACDADWRSLVRAQHYCNAALWDLEDEARRLDVDATAITELKRRIDGWNQTRNDLVERLDVALIQAGMAGTAATGAEQHSETAGQIIDRLSILALKVWHMREYAARSGDPAVAAECRTKVDILAEQRRDLAQCLQRLLADCRAGRRFFKLYRQFKAYNDPRLNPALQRRE